MFQEIRQRSWGEIPQLMTSDQPIPTPLVLRITTKRKMSSNSVRLVNSLKAEI